MDERGSTGDGRGAAPAGPAGSVAARLATMLEAGCGLIVGATTPEGEPEAERAWGMRVLDEAGRRVRVTVSADDERVLSGIGPGRMFALTGADVRTLTSVQLKGPVTWTGPADETDLAVMEDQTARFFEVIHELDGNPIEQLWRLLPIEVVAVEFEIADAFDQSAGPGAGSRVTAA